MNNEQIDVARRIMELADTLKKGLNYAVAKSSEGDLESTNHMLTNVLEALTHIEASLQVVELAGDTTVQDAGERLKHEFLHYLERAEAQDYPAMVDIVTESLLLRYDAWHQALNKVLRPHLAS